MLTFSRKDATGRGVKAYFINRTFFLSFSKEGKNKNVNLVSICGLGRHLPQTVFTGEAADEDRTTSRNCEKAWILLF